MSERQLWVIGGPNGAGKSTLVKRTHLGKLFPFVNPDNIARELSPANPEGADARRSSGRTR